MSKEKVPKKDESRYSFTRSKTQKKDGAILMFDSVNMVKNMKEYIAKDVALNHEQNDKKSLGFSKICTFLGKIKENLSVEKETFFECDCASYGYGTRCQYREEHYNAINLFITQMLKDVRAIFNSIFVFNLCSLSRDRKQHYPGT